MAKEKIEMAIDQENSDSSDLDSSCCSSDDDDYDTKAKLALQHENYSMLDLEDEAKPALDITSEVDGTVDWNIFCFPISFPWFKNLNHDLSVLSYKYYFEIAGLYELNRSLYHEKFIKYRGARINGCICWFNTDINCNHNCTFEHVLGWPTGVEFVKLSWTSLYSPHSASYSQFTECFEISSDYYRCFQIWIVIVWIPNVLMIWRRRWMRRRRMKRKLSFRRFQWKTPVQKIERNDEKERGILN